MSQHEDHTDDYETKFVPPHHWNCNVPLNRDMALDYFACPGNPFYNRTCDNAQLRQQGQSLRQLVRFRGLQYALHAYSEPPLPAPGQPYVPPVYVIAKVRRTGERPSDVKMLALFYIVDHPPVIYQAPNLYAVVAARLDMCAHHVLAAHDALVKGVRFVPAQGFSWSFGSDGGKAKKRGADKGFGAKGGGGSGAAGAGAGALVVRKKVKVERGGSGAAAGAAAGASSHGAAAASAAAGASAPAAAADDDDEEEDTVDVKWTQRRAALHEQRCGQHRAEFFANARAIDSILRAVAGKKWTGKKKKKKQSKALADGDGGGPSSSAVAAAAPAAAAEDGSSGGGARGTKRRTPMNE